MAQPSSSSSSSSSTTSSGSKKPKADILSPLTKGYLGETGRIIFDDKSRKLAQIELACYYKSKAHLEELGIQKEAEWDGSAIDYAMYYYHRFFHDEGCICPHEFGPGFRGPGKWAGGAYNCYDPKEFPATASGTPPQTYQADENAGESSAMAAKSLVELERQRWDKIQAYWKHESMESPFVPSTFEEYLKFKNETVKAKQLALLKKVDDFNKSMAQNYGLDRARMSPRLLKTHYEDGLSLVSSRVSIWHQNPTLFIPIDWPIRWEYEYYQGKQLPLPRTQRVDEMFDTMVMRYDLFPDYGPRVPRQFRRIAERALNPCFDSMTVTEFEDIVRERRMKIAEFEMDDLDGFTRELLQDIDGDGSTI
ncbi:hypothetical protein F4811DRAFT_573243 [Daldinia bambusicola]|nr:hypothetical protein F4811DRAFT_573243 [Daldinia bambusicola]